MQSLNFLSLLSLLLLLGTISSAWPWPPNGLNVAHGEIAARADTTASDQTTASKTDSTSQTNTAKDSSSTDSSSGTDTATGTAKETGTQTETGKTTGTGTQTGTGKTTGTGTGKSSKTTTSSISIDPRLPPGGISMLIPTAGATTYYKIGQYVTFAWNYTSLVVTPTAVNVLATCTSNQATYTLTSNMSVEATGKVVWDTGKYQANATVPLLTATYTLYVVDVDKDIGDVAGAGYLGSQIGYPFGMYLPQRYTPLNEFNCATCSSALSETERQALKFAFGMVIITIASFTWFAGGSGVLFT